MDDKENIKNELEEIKTARDNIKTALQNEGETVTDDIRTYAEKIPNVNKVTTVNSVEADTNKNVQIDASKINIDDTAETKKTIKESLTEINNKVDAIAVPEYSVTETTVTEGYSKTYTLTKDGTEVGVKINIPKDLVINKGSIKIVAEADTPYEGAIVGDKYLDIELNDPTKDHIYIPVKELVDAYTGKNNTKLHTTIGSNNSIEVQLQPGSIEKADLTEALQQELNNKTEINNITDGFYEGSLLSSNDLASVGGKFAIALGSDVNANNKFSIAIGEATDANGDYSIALGKGNSAVGNYSLASGVYTTAEGEASHAEGSHTHTKGINSHAEGSNTIASGADSHTEGKYNIEDTANKYAHIIGNGSSDATRSNAHTVDWNGNGWFKGDVKVGGTGQDDTDAKTLATTEYVNDNIDKIYNISELGLNSEKTTNLEMYQEIYDRHKSGKDVYMSWDRNDKQSVLLTLFKSQTTNPLYVKSNEFSSFASSSASANGTTILRFSYIQLKIAVTDDIVTSVIVTQVNTTQQALCTNINYENPYTPQYAGSPATKKYVDENSLPLVYTGNIPIFSNITTDLTKYQEMYNKFKENKDVIFIGSIGGIYQLFLLKKDAPITDNKLHLYSDVNVGTSDVDSYSQFNNEVFDMELTISDDIVTNVFVTLAFTKKINALDPTKTYTTPFIPTDPGHPASKKYVDDNSPEAYGIFYWDGKSSGDNPDNIRLWINIFDTARLKTVLVFAAKDGQSSYNYRALFIINASDVNYASGNHSFYSAFPYNLSSTTTSDGQHISQYRAYVTIAFTDWGPSYVPALQYQTSNTSDKFLPTNTSSNAINFTPTKDMHPTTKKYVDDSITEKLANITGLTPEIVQTLPATGDVNKIYLITKEDNTTENDIYDEYLYINNKYEHIGSTDMNVDLTPYATKNYVNNEALDTYVYDISELGKSNSLTSGLEKYQEIYNKWKSGKKIIMTNNNIIGNFKSLLYVLSDKNTLSSSNTLTVYSNTYFTYTNNNTTGTYAGTTSLMMDYNMLAFTVENDIVTKVKTQGYGDSTYCLNPMTDYTTPYEPKYNGSPATKKYVDDNNKIRRFTYKGTSLKTTKTLTIDCNYTLDTNSVWVYLNGEKLVCRKTSSQATSEYSYYEASTNSVTFTSDFDFVDDDVIEVVVFNGTDNA